MSSQPRTAPTLAESPTNRTLGAPNEVRLPFPTQPVPCGDITRTPRVEPLLIRTTPDLGEAIVLPDSTSQRSM
jgi:hypothetical protein